MRHMLDTLIDNGFRASDVHEDCVELSFRRETLMVTTYACSDECDCGTVLLEIDSKHDGYFSATAGTTESSFPNLNLPDEPNVLSDFMIWVKSSLMNGVGENEPVDFSDENGMLISHAVELFQSGGRNG